MIRSFLKRKLTDDQLANIFVNGLVESIDNSFEVVCSILNDDPSFISSPKITNEYSSEFFIIVLAGNLFYLEENFDSDVKSRLESLILTNFSPVKNVPAVIENVTPHDPYESQEIPVLTSVPSK